MSIKDQSQDSSPDCGGWASAHLEDRFTGDHARVAHILEDVSALVENHSFITASKRWGEMQRVEQRHSDLEEEILSAAEKVFGSLVFLQEVKKAHRGIGALMGVAGQCLSEWNPEDFYAARVAIEKRLALHWEYERNVLLPGLKRLFKDTALRDEFFKLIIRN
jgi:hypothetical protein